MKEPASNHNSFDYIVVGGGSAGCMVAARLLAAKAGTVALIERGDKAEANPETLSADGFKYAFGNDKVMLDRMSTHQSACDHRSLYAGSGSVMGGSGAVNGMVYTRGDKRDFDEWPSGWKWQDVEPAFQKLEQGLHVRHREATTFTEKALGAAEAAGFKRKHGLNDGDLSGYMGYNDMNYEGTERRNTYTAFLREHMNNPQFTLFTKCLTHKIIFDGTHTVGVEAAIKGKKRILHANKEVILSAGALETPKLLMLSGVGPKDHLQTLGIKVVKDVPSIGSNLHDHPNVTFFMQGRKPVDFGYPQVYGFYRANPALPLPAGQADTCIAWLAAPVTMQESMKRMAPATLFGGKYFFNPLVKGFMRFGLKLVLLLPPVNNFINNLYGIVVILGKPLSRGTLRLASTNPKDPAIVDLAFYKNPVDMETILNGVEMAKKIAAHDELKSWGNRPLAPASRSGKREVLKKWVYNTTMTTFHYCGTCSMGESPDRPVDTSLKLKGFTGLRIADASAIPAIPVSALNAPTMMVGYRAADFILSGK
jgi:choline dehydrogenase